MSKQAATQTATQKKAQTAAVMELPRYHFLLRIVGQQRIEGQVLDGSELDTVLNSWLTDYDLAGVDYLGQHRDQANTILGHQFGYHLIRKEA